MQGSQRWRCSSWPNHICAWRELQNCILTSAGLYTLMGPEAPLSQRGAPQFSAHRVLTSWQPHAYRISPCRSPIGCKDHNTELKRSSQQYEEPISLDVLRNGCANHTADCVAGTFFPTVLPHLTKSGQQQHSRVLIAWTTHESHRKSVDTCGICLSPRQHPERTTMLLTAQTIPQIGEHADAGRPEPCEALSLRTSMSMCSDDSF